MSVQAGVVRERIDREVEKAGYVHLLPSLGYTQPRVPRKPLPSLFT
jgi:hypothetical protein